MSKFLCVSIVEGQEYESIEVDKEFNGKVVEGFNVKSFNKEGKEITTFIPKETFVQIYHETEGMIYPQALSCLLTYSAIRRKKWEKGTYIKRVEVGEANIIVQFYIEDGNYKNRMYQFCNDDLFSSDYEIYYDE